MRHGGCTRKSEQIKITCILHLKCNVCRSLLLGASVVLLQSSSIQLVLESGSAIVTLQLPITCLGGHIAKFNPQLTPDASVFRLQSSSGANRIQLSPMCVCSRWKRMRCISGPPQQSDALQRKYTGLFFFLPDAERGDSAQNR